MQKVFFFSIVVIALFGWFDALQIIPWQQTQNWEPYNQHVTPAILSMWWIALGAIAFMYYMLVKDKSEAIGLSITSIFILSIGTEDIFFFWLGHDSMPAQMCWLTGPQTIVSNILGEQCVTPLSLYLNVIIGLFVAYKLLGWFYKQKW